MSNLTEAYNIYFNEYQNTNINNNKQSKEDVLNFAPFLFFKNNPDINYNKYIIDKYKVSDINYYIKAQNKYFSETNINFI